MSELQRWITVSVLNSANVWEIIEREKVSASSQRVGDVSVSAFDIGGLVGQPLLVELRDEDDRVLDAIEIAAS